MSGQDSEGHLKTEYGRRLVPVIIDEAARDTPDRTYAAIPRSSDLSEGFQDITYKRFANAINRVSFWLDSQFGKSDAPETFAYAGPKDLRYTILTVAAIKTGCEILLPSPFASLEAQLHVLDTTRCRTYLCPGPSVPLIEKIRTQRPHLRLVVVPDCERWLDEEMVEDYAYKKSFEQAKEDTFMIVHTSGTTGLPKPVRYTNVSIATVDAHHDLPDPEEKLWWRLLARRRMFSPMPTLHIAGMACSLLYPAFFETIAILGPGSAPVSVDIANQVLRFGHVDGALYPPSLLEDICRSAAALETIKTLKFVIFGGSPLKKAVGDLLSKQVKLMDYIGSTEVGSYPLFQLEPTDWDYFRFHPFFEFEMEPRSGGTYELVLHQTDKSKDFSSIFHLYPHLKEYRTKDLWLKHPTKKDLWRYHGRTDDLIVLSHGEDLDPTHMEAVIQRHARVRSAIVAGEGRIRPFLLLEPVVDSSSSDEDRKEMIDDIWPIVQVANGLCSEYVKLTRPLIVITSPEKRLKRLAKGSVDRRDSLREYQLEIDAVYDGVEPKTGE